MVELEASVSKAGILYIPKEIREAFGRRMKVITNARAALFFPAGAPYEEVLGSLRVIAADLEHRINLAARRSGLTGTAR